MDRSDEWTNTFPRTDVLSRIRFWQVRGQPAANRNGTWSLPQWTPVITDTRMHRMHCMLPPDRIGSLDAIPGGPNDPTVAGECFRLTGQLGTLTEEGAKAWMDWMRNMQRRIFRSKKRTAKMGLVRMRYIVFRREYAVTVTSLPLTPNE